MKNYTLLLCNILTLSACVDTSIKPISLLQKSNPYPQMEKSSASMPGQASCPLQTNQSQEPLRLSKAGGYPTLAFSPDSHFVAIADDSGGSGVIIWDLLAHTSRNILPSSWGGQLRFSPDGKRLAVGLKSGDVLLANLVDNTFVRLTGHQRSINAVSFSSDGQYVATSSADNTARTWDLQGKILSVLPGIPETKFGDSRDRSPSVSNVSWGMITQLLTIPSGKYVQVWQLPNKKLMTLKADQMDISDAVFSPNGKMIAAASDSAGKVWDLSGHQLTTLSGHTERIGVIRFSPDGQKLLTASDDRTARLWDLKGNALVTFRGHEDAVTRALFSPDGKCVFTSSMDDTVRIWDMSGLEIARLPGSFVMNLSPDGRYLATAESNTVLVWKLR